MNRIHPLLAFVAFACGGRQLDSYTERDGRESGGNAGSSSPVESGGSAGTPSAAGAATESNGGAAGSAGAGGASGRAGNGNSASTSGGAGNASAGGSAGGTSDAGGGGIPNSGGKGGTAGASGLSGQGGSSAGTGGVDLPMGDCPTDLEHLPLVGVWEGQRLVEGANGYEPAETMRLAISGSSEQGVCGTLTFGDGELLAPATDPDEAYPQPYT